MKIHGSTNNPESIIITKNDYDNFYKKGNILVLSY
ncbi:SIR2 family protein [Providencia hangzhouensis]